MPKYLPLTEYLRSQGGKAVRLTFEQFEKLCGPLPPAARKYSQWWANQRDISKRPQAAAWTNAGYQVGVKRLVEGWVEFKASEQTTDRTELRTERLLLRPIALDDFPEILAYSQDEEWGRWTPDPKPYTRRFGEEFVARKVLAPWETAPRFSIVLDGTVVGGIGLEIDTKNNVGELAYSLAREHWRKGLVPEAGQCVIAWAFRDLGLEKVIAKTDLRNARSTRVMEKLGMTLEAHLRSHVLIEGVRQDEVHYGLLRQEWESQQ